MSSESVKYERFVRDVVEALLRAQGLETVKVEHDIPVQGISRSHQVDVYWEYRLGGVLHRVVINCKRYGGTVEVTDVLTMKGVIDDMPGARGVVVTTVGYQKGAVDYATTHGIGLKIIREPLNEDYGDRLRAIHFVLQPRHYDVLGMDFELDRPWVAANLSPEDEAKWKGRIEFSGPLTKIENMLDGTELDLNRVWNAIREERGATAVDELASHSRLFEDAYISTPGYARAKLRSIQFRWVLRRAPDVEFRVAFDAAAIVRDAIAGTLLFVDPNGVVSGDVEQEFGRPRS